MSWTIILLGFILFVGGIAGLAAIILGKIPTLAKLSQEKQPSLNGKIGEGIKTRFHRLKYSNLLPSILGWLEKNLRKFRLAILRIDNLFVSLIKHARERSDVWTIRSKAWMEDRRLKKKKEIQSLEELDKTEVSQTIQNIEKEVAKDEDAAFKEKVEIVNSVDEEAVAPEAPAAVEVSESPQPEEEEEEEILTVTEEEKKYIDAIAQNPKDVESYRALCDIYISQQSYSDARACFRQVLKLDPKDEVTRAKLESIKGLRSAKKK